MAIRAIDYGTENAYISKSDPEQTEEAGATVFYFKAIPNNVMAGISDMQSESRIDVSDTSSQTFLNKVAGRNRKAFRFGVVRWTNFQDQHGRFVEVKTEVIMDGGRQYTVVSEESMNLVPLSIVNEVGGHIFANNTMTETQRKNFEELFSQFGSSATSNAATATPKNKESGDASSLPELTTEPPSHMISTPTTQKAKARTGKTRSPAKSATVAPVGHS